MWGRLDANGLHARDFLTPVAAYEDPEHVEVISKYGGRCGASVMEHFPLNVVGWHGNYAPYNTDLARFNTLNIRSFDHPDPRFHRADLTSEILGTQMSTFDHLPPRWGVAGTPSARRGRTATVMTGLWTGLIFRNTRHPEVLCLAMQASHGRSSWARTRRPIGAHQPERSRETGETLPSCGDRFIFRDTQQCAGK